MLWNLIVIALAGIACGFGIAMALVGFTGHWKP